MLGAFGSMVLGSLTFVGECVVILMQTVRFAFTSRFEFGETVDQMAFVGTGSTLIVVLTTFCSGAVLSLYSTQILVMYSAGDFAGATAGLAVTRELGPVIAGITVAARCGSAMAAQVATMTVTEQVDAMRMLSVQPTSYLVMPRLLAAIIMLPMLTLIGDFAGGIGSQLVAETSHIPRQLFLASIQQFVKPWDLLGGMMKAPVFGLIIALVASQQGLRAKGGALGVGQATRNTVVISIVLIYVANFFLATVFFRS